MTILWGTVLVAIVWTALGGSALLAAAQKDLSGSERIAWGLSTGLGLQAFLLPLVDRVPLTGPLPLLAAGAILAALGLAAGRGFPPRPALPAIGPAAVLLLVIAAAAFAVAAVAFVSEPMWANDYLAIWGLKGKTIFFSGSIPARLFHDPALEWSHPEYPLGLPLALAALARIAGGWNDHALSLLYPATEAATLLALFGYLRRRAGSTAAAAATLLSAAFFGLYRAFSAGMAEVPAALGFVLSAEAFLDLLEGDTRARRLRAIAATVVLASLKQEGLVWGMILAGALALGTRGRAGRLAAAACFLIPAILPAAIATALRGPLADRDLDATLALPSRLAELARNGATVMAQMWRGEILPLAVPLGALLVFAIATHRCPADRLAPVLAVQLLLYICACAFAVDPAWQEQTALPRIIGALWPAATILIGERLGFSCGSAPPPVQ